MTKKLSKEHKFNLIENAHDSLQHAIKHMKSGHDNSTGDWKFIIVSLAHVMELLFKEKLREFNPALVYENIDHYKPSSNSMTVKTVGAENALKRLEQFGKLQFTESDKKSIAAARDKRNQIEHFEFVTTEQEAKAITGKTIDFIFRFSKEHLELDWKSHLNQGEWNALYENTEFYKNHKDTANKKIETEQLEIIECPSCFSEFFSTEYEKCLLCGYKEELLECKGCHNSYLYSSVEYEEMDLCPNCKYGSDGYNPSFEKY